MSVDYNQRCAEKACPFHVEPGSLLCRFHRQSFTYGMSMEDNAVPFMDSLRSGLNTGFRLPARPAASTPAIRQINREDRRIRIVTQILATGNLLPGCISALEFASPRDREDLFTRLEPAQDLFTAVRYPDGQHCILCGFRDVLKTNYTGRLGFYCPLCRYTRTLLSQTLFVSSHTEPCDWLRAIWTLKGDPPFGCLKTLSEQIGFSENAAVRFNRKIKACGTAIGINIGYSHASLAHLAEMPVTLARGRGYERVCQLCDQPVLPGQFYRTKHRQACPWIHENCYQLKAVSLKRSAA